MPKMKKVGPTRGFGVRYGATVRKRYIEVVTKMKTPQKCPQCSSKTVRRRSVGIWNCRKCGFTFTGGAYVPSTKLGIVARRAAKGIPLEAQAEAAKAPEGEE
jgi:large subunit ribosomal protein L37Ae